MPLRRVRSHAIDKTEEAGIVHRCEDGYWKKEPEVLSESKTTKEDGLKNRDKSDEENIVLPRCFKESIIVIKSKSGTMKPIVSASLAEFTDVFTITACPIVNSWVPS